MAFRQNRMFWYFFTECHLISRFRNATGQIGGWFTIPGRQRKSASLLLICKTKASNQQTVCEFTKARVTYCKPIAGTSRQSEVLCALKSYLKLRNAVCCLLFFRAMRIKLHFLVLQELLYFTTSLNILISLGLMFIKKATKALKKLLIKNAAFSNPLPT